MNEEHLAIVLFFFLSIFHFFFLYVFYLVNRAAAKLEHDSWLRNVTGNTYGSRNFAGRARL